MEVSIIIPTRDRGEVFNETLRSVVSAAREVPSEIIVINDSKLSRPFIPEEYRHVRLVDNPKSGVASARNLGALLAQADLLIFMDDDFLIPENCFRKVIEMATRAPRRIHLFNWVYPPEIERQLSELQFGRYLTHFGFTSLKGWMGAEWREHEDVFELKDGASYFLPIHKSIFREIGGYNEDFPHAGAEDYDFIQQAKKKGVTFYLDKRCLLYHNERDRLNFSNWMERKKRNGETIRMAVDMGHAELAFHYSPFQVMMYNLASRTKFLLRGARWAVPNFTWLDSLYFRITNLLLSVYLYEGYTKSRVG